MRAIGIILALTLASAIAPAQQPAELDLKTFASSAEVAALIAKAKNERKPDQATYGAPILRLAPYKVNLEYRAAVGPATIHETEAELFYVIDGSGTLTTGGKLVNEKRASAENLAGTGIEGGSARTVSKGDFILVPEKTAHWFSEINGTLILMSMHMPRNTAAH